MSFGESEHSHYCFSRENGGTIMWDTIDPRLRDAVERVFREFEGRFAHKCWKSRTVKCMFSIASRVDLANIHGKFKAIPCTRLFFVDSLWKSFYSIVHSSLDPSFTWWLFLILLSIWRWGWRSHCFGTFVVEWRRSQERSSYYCSQQSFIETFLLTFFWFFHVRCRYLK